MWATDITFIATREGWLYLAVVLDLYSRRVVGWAMSSRINQSLVVEALTMAIAQRRPAPGLIHHSGTARYSVSQAPAVLRLKTATVTLRLAKLGDLGLRAIA